MSKVIDATLRFVDKFTSPMNNAIKSMERSAKQAQRMGKEIQKSGKKISDVGSGLTKGLTTPILAAGVASFKLASDLNESINKVDVAFGKNANNIKKWSKTTLESYGISQGTALDMAATFGDMGGSMGLSAKKSATMSKELVGLAGNLASFKNISVDVANTAVTGIFTGETESLKKLGIVMTETNLQSYALEKGLLKSTVSADKMKGLSTKVAVAQENLAQKIKKYGSNSLETQKAQISLNSALENQSKYAKGSFKDLSQAEKVQIRYKYVMDMSKNSQGDFARTSSGAANQMRMFTEGVKQLGSTLGAKLLPIGTKVVTMANSLITKFSGMSDAQQDTLIKTLGMVAAIGPGILVIGKLTEGVGGAIKTVGKFGGALKKSSDAFDGLKKVGPVGKSFSKFGILGKSAFMMITNPAFIAVAAISAIVVIAVLVIKNWTKVRSFFVKVGNTIKSVFTQSGGNAKKFGVIFTSLKNTVSKMVSAMGVAFSFIVKYMTPVVNFLSQVFVAGFKVSLSAVGGFVSGLVNGIADGIAGITTILDGLTTFLSGVFTGNWSKAWTGVKDIFKGIFSTFGALAKTPINAVIGVINGAISGINKIGIKIPDWVPGLGGKDFSINIPTIPMLAKGTKNWGGGLAITQERGGEIMDLPRGTRVYPHDKSVQMAREEGSKGKGGLNINISKLADEIIVRSDNDIKSIVNELADELWKRYNNTGKVVTA